MGTTATEFVTSVVEIRNLILAVGQEVQILRGELKELRGKLRAEAPQQGLLNRRALRAKVPVSDATLWRWIQAGTFPAPRYRGGRRYWDAAAVDAWLASNPKT